MEYAASIYHSDTDIIPPTADRPIISASAIERVSDKKHIIIYNDSDRNCVVCSTSYQRKIIKYRCSGCTNKSYLHPKYFFKKYHSR